MEAQVSSLKEQVDKKGRIANALADRVEKLTRQKVIAEASAGLADTQIAKLTELVEDVEFINEDTFTKKVSTIREFYVNRRAANDKNTLNENVDDNASFISTETIVENTIEGESVSPSMQNYLSAMSRMNKATTANLVG
jgi:DNA primase large subunit